MARINDTVAAFLTEDKNHKVTQKRIHYSKYSIYEKELLEFCIWVNDIENFNNTKKTLMQLPISFFCNNSALFLNYIKKRDNKDSNCLTEIKAITDCLFIYQAILYKYQLFPSANQIPIQQYTMDELNHLFGLYQYYLYQDNSPIIEDARKEFLERIKELPQNELLLDIYSEIVNSLENDLKKKFIKLSKARIQSRIDLAAKDLYNIHRETKTKVMIHKKRSEGLRRRN